MKKKTEPRKIFTYDLGVHEWKSRMVDICKFANEVGDKYKLLGIGDFSKETLQRLDIKYPDAYLEGEIQTKLCNECVPATLIDTAFQELEPKIKEVVRAFKNLKGRIMEQWANSRLIERSDALQIENIPFNGDRAEVTSEAVKSIEERYFINIASTPFELELYEKLELARDAINAALKRAMKEIEVHEGISDFLYYDEATGLMQIHDAEFGNFRYRYN